MPQTIHQTIDGFWNIRGSFKIGGLLDIGTHMSLARLSNGKFALLDACQLEGDALRQVMELTDQGRAIEAVLHLHPFHTIYVKAAAEQFPDAKLYGTARHVARAPDLPWETLRTEDPALHDLFAQDFLFTVPQGVDFIPENENLHFASVIAVHKASRTMHVDDTLMWSDLPLVGGLSFHPTLRFVLQKRGGAAADFRAWAKEFVSLCGGVDNLCLAHTGSPPPEVQAQVAHHVQEALEKLDGVLHKHALRYM